MLYLLSLGNVLSFSKLAKKEKVFCRSSALHCVVTPTEEFPHPVVYRFFSRGSLCGVRTVVWCKIILLPSYSFYRTVISTEPENTPAGCLDLGGSGRTPITTLARPRGRASGVHDRPMTSKHGQERVQDSARRPIRILLRVANQPEPLEKHGARHALTRAFGALSVKFR